MINQSELDRLKRHIRTELYEHGKKAVPIAQQNARVDTGAMQRSIRFESIHGSGTEAKSDEFQLIAGGVTDPARPEGVHYAGTWEIVDGYLRSTLPYLLKFGKS